MQRLTHRKYFRLGRGAVDLVLGITYAIVEVFIIAVSTAFSRLWSIQRKLRHRKRINRNTDKAGKGNVLVVSNKEVLLAQQALMKLGYPKSIAVQKVDCALAAGAASTNLEEIIRTALKAA